MVASGALAVYIVCQLHCHSPEPPGKSPQHAGNYLGEFLGKVLRVKIVCINETLDFKVLIHS